MKNLSFILFFVTFNLFCQTDSFQRTNYIETIAVSDTLVNPDRITLSILISEKDSKGKFSTEELEQKMISVLKSLNINIEKQLALVDVSSNFKKYFLKKQDVLKNKSFSLLTYTSETAGKVITALEKLHISNVYLTKLSYSKYKNVENKVLKNAVIAAKKKADVMLNSLNQKTGKVIYISDFDNQNLINSLSGKVPGIRIRGNSSINTAYGIKREKSGFNIEFEKIKIEKRVSLKFEIE